ncbi:MAG: GNAT family N-acetyltransferase [Sphaerochaetaceae bacterium]|nr:GNAT family N-acetyltransferase [Sphaerochaetaceae bacterium]
MQQFSEEKQIQFLIDASFIDSHAFEGYTVAELEGDVVGVMLLKWRGQIKGKPRHRISVFRLFKNYGFWQVIQMIILALLLKEDPTKDECYISHIAVAETARGHGIGTRLLKYSLQYTKEILGLSTTSLYVASSNTSARSLYERTGFEVHREKKSRLTSLALHETTWIHMRLSHREYSGRPGLVMKNGWWLGCFGLLGIPHLDTLLLFLKGEAPAMGLIGLSWFLMFSYLIPEKR